MRTLVQFLMSVVFVAIMVGLRWGWDAVDRAWPERGLAAVFLVAAPAIIGFAVYLDRRDDGKTKDFWGNPLPSQMAYDFDLQPVTRASKALRYYAMFGLAAGTMMWLGCLYVVLR